MESTMKLTIRSRKLGKKITFSRPGSDYIYVDLNGKPGTLGHQICIGGELFGSAIFYHGVDNAEFEKICRRWYRKFVSHF